MLLIMWILIVRVVALKTFSAVETYLKNHEQEILIDFARYAQSKLGVDMRSTYLRARVVLVY